MFYVFHFLKSGDEIPLYILQTSVSELLILTPTYQLYLTNLQIKLTLLVLFLSDFQ